MDVSMVSDQTPKDYGSAKAYADEVRSWHLKSHEWLNYQYSNYVRNNPEVTNPAPSIPLPALGNVRLNIHHRRIFVDRNIANNGPIFIPQAPIQGTLWQRLFNRQNVNYQQDVLVTQRCTIPPFTRRIMAELIDFVILFFLKMAIVYSLVEFEILDLNQLEQILTTNADLQSLIDLTQGLFHLEVMSKIFSGILEALCVTYGFMNYPPGCTPGKFIMGIQVVSCLNVQAVTGTHDQIVVTKTPRVSLRSSLIRSLLKNLVTNFLFPINGFFYTFTFNRSVYDMAAKTIVVVRERNMQMQFQ